MNNNQFKKDIIDLFSKKRGGHVQKWLYSDHIREDKSSGSRLWHHFIKNNKKYYPIQREIELIPSFIDSEDHDYDTVIDFGLGDKQAINHKILPILESQSKLKRYAAIDISANQLNAGMDIVQCQFKNIEIDLIKGDFYQKHKDIKGQKKLGLFFGSTISNQEMMVGEKLPEKEIIERIKILSKTTLGEEGSGTLVISLDTNPALQESLNAYQHQSWVLMMTGLMHDVQDILHPTGNFNPTLWHYAPIIDKKNYVLQQVITPTVDQTFIIDEHEFSLKKGEQFVVKNNFKFPLDLFKEMIKKAKLKERKAPTILKNNPIVMIKMSI